MKVNGAFLAVIGIFFGIIGLVYWFTAYEDAGFLMLIGSALLGLLPGGYYLWWSRRMRPLEGDVPDATIADGAGVIDSFPGSSIWPFLLGHGRPLRHADLHLRPVARPHRHRPRRCRPSSAASSRAAAAAPSEPAV